MFGLLAADEFGIVAILAGLVLSIGPLLLAFTFFRTQQLLAGAALLGLWILAAAVCVRDFRRQRFSWLSGFPAIMWLVATLVLWWYLEFRAGN